MKTQGTYEYLCSYTVWNSELYRVQEDGIYCFLFRGASYTDIGVCGLEIGEITLMTVEEAFAAAEVTGLPYGATVELGGNDSIFFRFGRGVHGRRAPDRIRRMCSALQEKDRQRRGLCKALSVHKKLTGLWSKNKESRSFRAALFVGIKKNCARRQARV